MSKNKKSKGKKDHKKVRLHSKKVEVISLHPNTKKWIVGIVIILIAIISILALFQSAGVAGLYMMSGMTALFGVLSFLTPLILLLVAFGIINKDKTNLKTINYFGIIVFVLSLTALFNIFLPREEIFLFLAQGKGGGYVGLILSYPLMKILGFIASFLVLLATLIIGALLFINNSLEDIADSENIFGRMLASIQSKWYDLRYGNLSEEGESDDADDTDAQIDEEGEQEQENQTEDNLSQDDGAENFFQRKSIKSNILQKSVKFREVGSADEVLLPKKKVIYKKVDLPLSLLDESSGKATSGNPIKTKEKIKATLESFNIQVEMGEVNIGPTVTQYELIPSEGIKLSRITALQDDLALALAAHPLRIEAPIPGKSAVGVEIPNTSVAIVRLKELLGSKNFKSRKSNLEIALGKDVSGKVWSTPLDKMPHLLVAGATGSGKSVCLNTIIVSLLYQNSPETLRFIMVDPKKVELSAYENVPHLLTPVITDVKKTVNALKWAVAEMDKRYNLLQKMSVRNIDSYNEKVEEKMPHIVFIIDEMADLMVTARNEVETLIIRLAQMARAVGIHLVLATQRPSVDVITGLIKANIPSRIAFAVASVTDSRTILDASGADKLIGKGDMLFTNPQQKKPIRIQGAFLSEEEVERVVEYLKVRSEGPIFEEGVVEKQNNSGNIDYSDSQDGDELFDEAKDIVIGIGKASTSLLQRKLKIGYSRAARIIDLLEDAGIVSEADGSRPREILVTKQEADGWDIAPEELQPTYDDYDKANDNETYDEGSDSADDADDTDDTDDADAQIDDEEEYDDADDADAQIDDEGELDELEDALGAVEGIEGGSDSADDADAQIEGEDDSVDNTDAQIDDEEESDDWLKG